MWVPKKVRGTRATLVDPWYSKTMDNKLPRIGDLAPLYLCGDWYDHVIIEVHSATRIVVAQGSTIDTAFGPKEVVARRKSGQWVPSGAARRSAGYHSVYCR